MADERLMVEVAGERLELLADRALHWPTRRRLLVADLHLGKGDVFRRAGIALPRGGTSHDLERLARLVAATRAEELWVLGDLLHGPVHETAWQHAWRGWRAAHASLRVASLVGNHDRSLAASGMEIDLLGAAVDEGPFAFRHEPTAHASLHVMCGHLHPQVALPGLRRRLPAFWLRPGVTVLPAFSAFTGGVVVQPSAGERLAVCAEGSVTMVRG